MAGQVRQDRINLTVTINGEKAGGTLKEMRGTIRDLKRELDKLTVGSAEYNKKAAELARATAAYNNQTKAIKDQTAALENAGKKVNPFTDALKKGALAAVAFFSVQRIIQWGQQLTSWLLKGTAALEANQRKTAIVFGEAIDIVQDAAAINAQALGLTETAYASLAAKIGDILIPMGFQREEAAKLSTDLTDLSGALSEWSGGQRTAEEVSKILTKALTGERESLKELGIVITEADVSSRLLAKGQKELTGAALQQAKALINYELILERSKDAQTAFATNQDSLARTGTRLTGVWNNFKEQILGSVLGPMRSLGKAIADTYAPIKRQSDQVQAQQALFNVQIETLKKGNISQENRAKLISTINTQYKEYLPNLLTEKTSLEDINAIQDQVNQKFTQRILLLATEESLRDVSQDLIAAKKQELDLALRLSTAEQKRQDLIATSAERAARSSSGTDRRGDDAIQLIRDINFEIEENKRLQAELTNSFEQTAAAARELGLDINAITNPTTTTTGGGGDQGDPDKKLKDALKRIEDLYNRERQIKIQSIEFLRDNEEEYAAERERINLEADIKIASAQAKLYKEGTTENLKLLQEALDKEAQLREQKQELEFSKREEQINRESELTKVAIREEIDDQEELSRKLEIEELNRQQRIAEVRLAGLDKADSEYIKLYSEITDRQLEIERRKQADILAIDEQTIELQRELTIAGIDQLKLDEEDLQKYRERINLEYDKKILEARLKTFDPDSLDGVKTKNAIADIDRQLAEQGSGFLVDSDFGGAGGSSTPEDQDKKRQRAQEAADAALGVANNVADSLLSIEQRRIDTQLQMELDAIDRTAEAKRRAAGDDAVELAKIDAQARDAREKAEKKAAIERKKLARKEAVIQGALAVIEALPNAFAAIATGIATALQLAVIDGQSFFYGGPTGSKGIYKDKSGHDVAGVVHTDEYVVPERIAQDPQHQPVMSYLENVRQRKGGFNDGGFTTLSTKPVSYVQTVSSGAESKDLQEIKALLGDIRTIAAAWPTVIKAVMAYTDFETTRDTVEDIRERSRS